MPLQIDTFTTPDVRFSDVPIWDVTEVPVGGLSGMAPLGSFPHVVILVNRTGSSVNILANQAVANRQKAFAQAVTWPANSSVVAQYDPGTSKWQVTGGSAVLQAVVAGTPMTAASGSSGGTGGTVPAPAQHQQQLLLSGAATWVSAIPAWVASTVYGAGAVVSVPGVGIYRCTTNHTAGGSFSDTNWLLISALREVIQTIATPTGANPTVNWDVSVGSLAHLTIDGTSSGVPVLAAPTNAVRGGSYSLLIRNTSGALRAVQFNTTAYLADHGVPVGLYTLQVGEERTFQFIGQDTNILQATHQVHDRIQVLGGAIAWNMQNGRRLQVVLTASGNIPLPGDIAAFAGRDVSMFVVNASGGPIDVSFGTAGQYLNRTGQGDFTGVTTIASGGIHAYHWASDGTVLRSLIDLSPETQALTYVASGTTAWNVGEGSEAVLAVTSTAGTTLAAPTNVRPGQMIDLTIFFTAAATVTFNSVYKFAGGLRNVVALRGEFANQTMRLRFHEVGGNYYLMAHERHQITNDSGTPAQTAYVNTVLSVSTGDNAITVTPPPVRQPGDWFTIVDTSGNAGTNNITVGFIAAGISFHGGSENYVINTDKGFAKFVFVDTTVGWVLAS